MRNSSAPSEDSISTAVRIEPSGQCLVFGRAKRGHIEWPGQGHMFYQRSLMLDVRAAPTGFFLVTPLGVRDIGIQLPGRPGWCGWVFLAN